MAAAAQSRAQPTMPRAIEAATKALAERHRSLRGAQRMNHGIRKALSGTNRCESL